MRLDQVEHHLHGDTGIDRAAAFAQDGEPGFRGERMRGDDHVLLRRDQRLRLESALAFRLFEGERTRRSSLAAKPSESRRAREISVRRIMAASIASLTRLTTRLVEIAGFGDDALGARMTARVPARMVALAGG